VPQILSGEDAVKDLVDLTVAKAADQVLAPLQFP
jgi:hypothetical protein